MNGLDAEGIAWIRQLMKTRAAQGGTIFISSHLMGEVQQVADHLILISRGELITQAPTDVLINEFTRQVIVVRSPQATALAELLTSQGAQGSAAGGDQLDVTGASMEQIGAWACAAGIELHELSMAHGSLESAYNQLTKDTVEFSTYFAGKAMDK